MVISEKCLIDDYVKWQIPGRGGGIPDLPFVRLLNFVGNSTCQAQIQILTLDKKYMEERVTELMPLSKFAPYHFCQFTPLNWKQLYPQLNQFSWYQLILSKQRI